MSKSQLLSCIYTYMSGPVDWAETELMHWASVIEITGLITVLELECQVCDKRVVISTALHRVSKCWSTGTAYSVFLKFWFEITEIKPVLRTRYACMGFLKFIQFTNSVFFMVCILSSIRPCKTTAMTRWYVFKSQSCWVQEKELEKWVTLVQS